MLLAAGLASGASGSSRESIGVCTPLAKANLLVALGSGVASSSCRGASEEKKLAIGIVFMELSGEKKGRLRFLPFLLIFPFLTTDDQEMSGVEQPGPFGSS